MKEHIKKYLKAGFWGGLLSGQLILENHQGDILYLVLLSVLTQNSPGYSGIYMEKSPIILIGQNKI